MCSFVCVKYAVDLINIGPVYLETTLKFATTGEQNTCRLASWPDTRNGYWLRAIDLLAVHSVMYQHQDDVTPLWSYEFFMRCLISYSMMQICQLYLYNLIASVVCFACFMQACEWVLQFFLLLYQRNQNCHSFFAKDWILVYRYIKFILLKRL